MSRIRQCSPRLSGVKRAIQNTRWDAIVKIGHAERARMSTTVHAGLVYVTEQEHRNVSIYTLKSFTPTSRRCQDTYCTKQFHRRGAQFSCGSVGRDVLLARKFTGRPCAPPKPRSNQLEQWRCVPLADLSADNRLSILRRCVTAKERCQCCLLAAMLLSR